MKALKIGVHLVVLGVLITIDLLGLSALSSRTTLGSAAGQQKPSQIEQPAELAAAPPAETLAPELDSDLDLRRSEFSQVRRLPDGGYAATLAAGALNYQDRQGQWQEIDPRFEYYEDSFVVERNSIQSRVGSRRAWLSGVVGEAIFGWQAVELGLLRASGEFTVLARPLENPPGLAVRRSDNSQLVYQHAWSQAGLTELLHSTPGSLEHSLVFDQAPSASASAETLELRASLDLLETNTLLADGQPILSGIRTANTLQIRDAQGQVVLQFEPVRAFEQEHPAEAVAGEYSIAPGAAPGEWIIGLRTPLAWWVHPQRSYPVVLDPVMSVLKPTSAYNNGVAYNNGTAWVSDQTNAYHYEPLQLGAYLPNYNSLARGYFQFHDLPAILANSPIKVKKATLEIQVADVFIPEYFDSPVDWDEKVLQRKVTLSYIGDCPNGCPNGFSLHDNRLSNPAQYNWSNSPAGNPVVNTPTQNLAWGPAKGKPKTHLTIWDVTPETIPWFTNHFAAPQDFWLTFKLETVDQCPGPLPYYQSLDPFNPSKSVFTYKDVPVCTGYTIPAENIKLQIEYDVLPLGLGQNLLNKPGVPSYSAGVFENTDHRYGLAPYDPNTTGGPHWRAVAVRGNHDYTAGLPATTSLQLWDVQNPIEPIGASAALEAEKTTTLFIDDHALPGLPGAGLEVSIPPFKENDFPNDLQRNYRLEYQLAEYRPITPGQLSGLTPLDVFYSNQLVKLIEFDITQGDNFSIYASAPITVGVALLGPLQAGLPEEAVLGFPSAKLIDLPYTPGAQRTTTVPNARGGRWAVALINHGHPILCTPGGHCPNPGGPTIISASVSVRACPQDSAPTGNYGCQAIRLPDANDPLPNTVDLPGTANDLLVYSEGGFQNVTGGWCTANEAVSTPIIGRVSMTASRWAFVANGHVCYANSVFYLASQNFATPARTAVGLAYPIPGGVPLDPRGQMGTNFIYGDPGAVSSVLGMKDGQVSLQNGSLFPTVNTLQNIKPFEMWNQANLQTLTYSIDTISSRLVGSNTLQTGVSLDVNQAPVVVGWQVDWDLYPSNPPIFGFPNYTFNVNVVQQNPLPAVITMASMELRLLTSGAPDGLAPYLLSMHTDNAPAAYQFAADQARITLDNRLGQASQVIQVVVLPAGLPRPPLLEDKCTDAGAPTSCLDLRGLDYAFNPVGAQDKPPPWSLPDVHIEEALGSLVFNRPGALTAFSADHPLSKPDSFAQSFNFDTWGAKVRVANEACYPGGPVTTVTHGQGYMALPGIGGDGSGDPSTWVKMTFTMCQTNLRETSLSLSIEPNALPVGSSGIGVGFIAGTVTVGPDFTEIVIDIHFRSMDGSIVTDGDGSVTINTAGMFSLQGSGKLVGMVRADTLELQVAWNPLDILFQGEVSCCGDVIEGFMNMHGWVGKGWQNKYPWISDNKFHFTGMIGGTVGIETGDLIDKKFFKLPPFDIGISANISFGDFCKNSNCQNYGWGMAATIELFGYDVGVFVDSSGPELFLGSSGIKLVDQFGGAGMIALDAGAAGSDLLNSPPPPPVQSPVAQYITWGMGSPFKSLLPESGQTYCNNSNPTRPVCPFSIPVGSNRALFIVTWLNGSLDISLTRPDNTVITPANAAQNGVTITTNQNSLGQMISFVVEPTSGQTIPAGQWLVSLDKVGLGLLPGVDNHYAISFAVDPPAPTVAWTNPVLPGTAPGGGGILNLGWSATRAGQALPDAIKAELVFTPKLLPQVFPSLVLTFPGSYQSASGLGADWDPSNPAILAEDTNHDGVWKLTTSAIPAGSYEFKVAMNGNWLVNYGLGGVQDGPNIPFIQPAGGAPLRFYFDANELYITTRPASDIVVLIGDMLSEIGGADWAPDNLVGWMKPTDNPALSELTLNLPAGSWQYKVAKNESLAINYGAGGIPNGQNILLNVPAGGALVKFTYDEATHLIQHTLLARTGGALISANEKANQGFFAWDTRGLATGEYLVGMRIDDHLKANGVVTSWAPGTVVINDSIPPPEPVYLGTSKYQSGLHIRWSRDDVTPDLAGYLIDYQIPNWELQPAPMQKTRRVLPVPKSVDPSFQRARLGGIFTGIAPTNEVTVCIRAYDASGNLSTCSPVNIPVPSDDDVPVGRVATFTLAPNAAALAATWSAPSTGVPDGYFLSYAPVGCSLQQSDNQADQGDSPIVIGRFGSPYSLTGLSIGQRYRVGVRAFYSDGNVGGERALLAMFGDPADGDDDQLPDAWEALYGISDPFWDDDSDGLANFEEFNTGTHPNDPDSDEDGFYDSEELEQGSDPCGPGTPPSHQTARLAVVASNELVLSVPVNQPVGDVQFLSILNLGAGDLDWTASTSQPWIKLSRTGGQNDELLIVSVDMTDFAPGSYPGQLTINASPALAAGSEISAPLQSVTIQVTVLVLPDKQLSVVLPLVRK